MEKVEYGGWRNCYRVANASVELIVTGDIGPRIIRFGFIGGANEFYEDKRDLGKTGGDAWRLYGGHRLWHAPEAEPRTYFPDNAAVHIKEHGGVVRIEQVVEPTTGLQKQIDLRLDPKADRVQLTHRLINRGLWSVEFAPWALSVMAPGGTCIIPLPPRGTHPECLLPCNTLTLWPYTDLSDPRWGFGFKYILLSQDAARGPQKIGVMCKENWTAYANAGRLFVKTFQVDADAIYPDNNSTIETFTNEDMLEVETLGPLVKLAPAAAVEHVETWHLFRDVKKPRNDADVEANILPCIEGIK